MTTLATVLRREGEEGGGKVMAMPLRGPRSCGCAVEPAAPSQSASRTNDRYRKKGLSQ